MVDTLERYFDANKTKPSDGQMITWASELKVPFDDVHEWFYKKWKGNIKSTYNLLLVELFFLPFLAAQYGFLIEKLRLSTG